MTDSTETKPTESKSAETKPGTPPASHVIGAVELPHHSTSASIALGVATGAAGAIAATALEAALFKKRGGSFGERFKNSHLTGSTASDASLFAVAGGFMGYNHAKGYNQGVVDGAVAVSNADRIRQSQQKKPEAGKDGQSK